MPDVVKELMQEQAPEKAESQRELRAANDRNKLIMEQMTELRAMLLAQQQQQQPKLDEPQAGTAASTAHVGDDVDVSEENGMLSQKKEEKDKWAEEARLAAASTAAASMSAEQTKKKLARSRSNGHCHHHHLTARLHLLHRSSFDIPPCQKKKKKHRTERGRGSASTPIKLRQARMTLAGLYSEPGMTMCTCALCSRSAR
eukprot:1331886-Pleurochrysis_carterae.AAC.1